MAAFHTDNDHLPVPALQELLKPPGLPIGRVLIEEQVVPVKEVHDRIPFLRLVVVVRKIDVQPAGTARRRIINVSLNNHTLPLLVTADVRGAPLRP